jgi:ATP-dependent DNA ligase
LTSIADFTVTGFAGDDDALSLSTWDGERSLCAGKAGAGYNPTVAPRCAELNAHVVLRPMCVGDVPMDAEMKGVTPTLVVELRYKSWPEHLSLREPVFLRFRHDTRPDECPTPKEKRLPEEPAEAEVNAASSNPSKFYLPQRGLNQR